MKILNNFDTKVERLIVCKYIEMYGEENVIVIHRAKIFWVLKVLFPFLFWISALIGTVILGLHDFTDPIRTDIIGVISTIMFLGILIMGSGILKKYLDYKMDFCVVTPNEVAMHNQSGLLKKNSRIIDADKIKTVSADTGGIMKSIFNFGNLIFLSEGDPSMGMGDISLNYVYAANDMQNKVRDIIEPHLQKNSTDISHIEETDKNIHD